MSDYSAYVGLDVHKDAIAVAVALPGRKEPTYRGEIKNERKSLLRLVGSLSPNGEVVSFCYEAGPCGYGVYREITKTGLEVCFQNFSTTTRFLIFSRPPSL